MKQFVKIALCLLLALVLCSCGVQQAVPEATGSMQQVIIPPATGTEIAGTENTEAETAAAETTTPELPPRETVADPITGLDDSYNGHHLLTCRAKGDSRFLVGSVVINVVLVDDPASRWTDGDIRDWKAGMDEATRLLESAAASYGVPLEVTLSYERCTVDTALDVNDYTIWRDDALEALGYKRSTAIATVRQRYGADEAAFIFCTNREGRPFAGRTSSPAGFECAVLFRGSSDYRHELMHLFGADDYYYPRELTQIFNKYFEESIMLSSSSPVIDELTAYTVGWTDTPSSSARAVLDESAWMTEEFVSEALKQETFTGNGAKHMGDNYYEGDMLKGEPHGKGVYTFASGTVYEGSFSYGDAEGDGVIRYYSGAKYEGYISNWKPEGIGKYTWESGDVYEGEFVDGKPCGTGVIRYANGNYYEGEMDNWNRHGKGYFRWASGAVYEGDFLEGTATGYGKMTWNSGAVYEGDMVNWQPHGYGVIRWPNGDRFEGNWVNNERHGQGTYYWANGAVQSGNWVNGELSK